MASRDERQTTAKDARELTDIEASASARHVHNPTATESDTNAIHLTTEDVESVSIKLTHKSLQAALAAIEIYNKPCFSYREESFSILMANAWELILKAKWVLEHNNDEKSLQVPDKKTGTAKKNRSGNPLTLDAISLSKKLLNDGKSGLAVGCHNNILALLEIRDNAVHFLHRDPHLDQRVLEVGMTSLQNYAQLAQRWFDLGLSGYDMFLMPISFRHGFETAQAISGIRRGEQVRNLLEYISNLEQDQPPGDIQRVAIYLETKLVRERNGSAIEFNWTNNPDAPALTVREEDVLRAYPMTYKDLTDKLKSRYCDFLQNERYHKLRQPLETDKRYSITRFLNPGNPKGGKKRFYSPNILSKFDGYYHRR